jgi:hypothetical protein
VVFLDAWHPGVISACYMRDMGGAPLKVTGILHAGAYDPHDRLAKAGMHWAHGFEQSLLEGMDEVLVGSYWHRTMLREAFPDHTGDVRPFHYPVRVPFTPAKKRDRVVVWPHRDVPEKTFGIAMVEAAQSGCRVIVPRRLSYPELFPKECLEHVDSPDAMGYAIATRIEAHESVGGELTPVQGVAVSEEVKRGDIAMAQHWAERFGS